MSEVIIKVQKKKNVVEYRNANGNLHNIDDLPAIVTTHKLGGFTHEWYRDGVRFREDGKPAIVYDYTLVNEVYGFRKMNCRCDIWFIDGERGRENDLPAYIRTVGTPFNFGSEEGYISHVEEWYKGGKLHREDDLPAHVKIIVQTLGGYNQDYSCERYHKNGKLHREGDLPAMIEENGVPTVYGDRLELWAMNDKSHRVGAPSEIVLNGTIHPSWDKSFKVPRIERWSIDGHYFSDYGTAQDYDVEAYEAAVKIWNAKGKLPGRGHKVGY